MRESLHVMISKKLDLERFDQTDKPLKRERPRAIGGASQPETKAPGGGALAVLDKPWGRSYL